jgi:hypothetical protein
LTHTENHINKSWIYFTDAFANYQSLQCFGKLRLASH